MGRRMPGLAAGRLRVLLGRSLREGRRLTLPGSPGSLQLLESALQRGFEFDHALAEFGHPLSEGGVLSRQFFVAGPRGVTCHNSIIHHCDTRSADRSLARCGKQLPFFFIDVFPVMCRRLNSRVRLGNVSSQERAKTKVAGELTVYFLEVMLQAYRKR